MSLVEGFGLAAIVSGIVPLIQGHLKALLGLVLGVVSLVG